MRRRSGSLISDVLPFGRLWYGQGADAIRLRQISQPIRSRCDRVYGEAGDVIETHEQAGEFAGAALEQYARVLPRA